LGEQRLGQGRERTLAALREDAALCARLESLTRERMAARREGRRGGGGGEEEQEEEGEEGLDGNAGVESVQEQHEKEAEEERAAALLESSG
jgi:hypothetical protein